MFNLDLKDKSVVQDIIANGKSVRGVVQVDLLDEDGSVLFTDIGENELLIGGALQIVQDMTGLAQPIKIHHLDKELGLAAHTAPAGGLPPQLFGMIVGTDGSTGIGSVTPVERKEKGYNIPNISCS